MSEKYVAYVGSYTHDSSKGITILDVDNEAGRMAYREEVIVNNSSYLIVSHSGRYLYSIVDEGIASVSYTHLRAHETDSYLVCRLLLEKKKTINTTRSWYWISKKN